MEELTEALSASFAVSHQPNSTAAPHPRLAQYKSKYSALEQSERRRRFLQLQKRCVWRSGPMFWLFVCLLSLFHLISFISLQLNSSTPAHLYALNGDTMNSI